METAAQASMAAPTTPPAACGHFSSHRLPLPRPLCGRLGPLERYPRIGALTATDFEDAIRNAISIGGDSDTVACIAGGVAEARFGIPEPIAAEGLRRLPGEMVDVVREAYRRGQRPVLSFSQDVGHWPTGDSEALRYHCL